MASQCSTHEGLRELALFAGAGGGILGGHLLGWRTVCAVERDPYAASVLCARQNEGILPPFPIWDDVCDFDGRPWRGRVDVVSGGFPCQDISSAGRGAGIDGARSGLWREMARIVGEVRPQFVFVENSPRLVRRGLAVVLGDLAALGYDARWGVLGAADGGAPHERQRIWIVADTEQSRSQGGPWCGMRRAWRQEFVATGCGDQSRTLNVADSKDTKWRAGQLSRKDKTIWASRNYEPSGCGWWIAEPNVGRVANGVAARVDRLKAIGNGQVPAVAALAWELLGGPVAR